MLKPFIHEAHDMFDLGGLGEHPLRLTAWIAQETDGHGSVVPKVNIVLAEVDIHLGGKTQVLDVTPKILDSHYTREAWEREIYRAWKAAGDWQD